MAAVALVCANALGAITSLSTFTGQVAQLAMAGGLGLAAYVGLAAAMKVEEVHTAWDVISARLRSA